MILRHRPLTAWPGPLTDPRHTNPFKATWTDTLDLLDRELTALRADPSSVVLQVAVGEADLRLDGQLRANARPTHPGVILSFETRTGPLSFPCDTFDSTPWRRQLTGWQVNVRAIALALEALRKVDRYGVTRNAEQYAGWRQIGSGAPMPPAAMTVEDAARVLHDACGPAGPSGPAERLITDRDAAREAYRVAAKRHHPDVGGDPALFRRLTEARDLLEAHT